MITIPDTATVYFDVDDTLVLWNKVGTEPPPGSITLNDLAGQVSLLPHTQHIEQVKRHANAGHMVVVWSQGGSEWAEKVVRALGLANYVNLVVTKPTFYYDDLDCQVFMGKRLYFEHRPQSLPMDPTAATDSNSGIV